VRFESLSSRNVSAARDMPSIDKRRFKNRDPAPTGYRLYTWSIQRCLMTIVANLAVFARY
jgi:hypothetical protein